ncbi:MAG: response regulator [Sphingobacteriia bacterium]|nr:response regulator [Sphingobacteriia bacterium]
MNSRPKVLLVDDIEQNLITLEAILSDFEITFMKALSGNEALSLALEHDFALAIIDIQMPEMDGYETVKLMRQVKRTRNLPIIYVSAIYKEEFHVIKGIETGAVDFIVKPIIPEILRGKVRVFLELYLYRVHLEKLVSNRTAQLEEAVKELQAEKQIAEAATRSKSLFLASMSHEIRTPLNGIIGMISLLKTTTLNTEQQDILSIINTSGDFLLNIVNDILDFSKIESGEVILEARNLNLYKLLEDIIKLFSFKSSEKSISLVLKIDPKVPQFIIGDQIRIKQILTNLVGNAIKFTHQGMVTLKVDLLDNSTDRVNLSFAISDTGIGMTQNEIKQIFTYFRQAEISTTRKYGGSGLGLAICKNLCALMGGSIRVESTPNVGSTFFVSLPFDIGEVIKEVDTSQAALPSNFDFSRLIILLAEDNLINQKVASMTLSRIGCHYEIVNNGIEAVEAFKRSKWDIILMDIQMPEMDGIEATRIIREEERKNKVVSSFVAAMTADAMPETREKCMDAGMNSFISKPFKPTDLNDLFLSYLSHKQQNNV